MPLDPNTSTRAEFTANHLAFPPPPEDANPKWARLFKALIALIKAIGEDEGMARNNQQAYITPATDKNAVYFAWDFVGRTSYTVNTDPFALDPKELWTDVLSRSALISSLLLDEKPGFLAQLVESTYPGHNPGGQPVMSSEVIRASEEVKEVKEAN